jgi:hypothetical protein
VKSQVAKAIFLVDLGGDQRRISDGAAMAKAEEGEGEGEEEEEEEEVYLLQTKKEQHSSGDQLRERSMWRRAS